MLILLRYQVITLTGFSSKATNGEINVFGHDIVKNIGKYIYRVYIANSDKGQYFANFSDASAVANHDPGRIIRYGKAINDHEMEAFGHYIMGSFLRNDEPLNGRIGESLENLFNMPIADNLSNYEPMMSEYYFPDREIAIARDGNHNNGFCFVAKGGSNGEGHNHNDVGSFMLFYKGKPVLIDVGVGTYTAKTFSPSRYEIWTMQSEYHNLPVINGFGQSPGGRFKASNTKFAATPRSVVFTTDISKAYPEVAKVEQWNRTFSLDRGKRFLITDSYRMEEITEAIRLHFMTPASCWLLQQGILELTVDDVKIQLNYDPTKLTVSSETIELDDPNLTRVWGEKLTRIVFKITSTKPNNEVSLNLTPVLSF